MRNVIVDTNAYSKLMLGNQEVQQILERALRIFIPSIVIGELYAGFKSGSREEKNKSLLAELLEEYGISVLDVTSETASYYADIQHILRKKGKPIPTNDIWIAACCMQTASALVTYDAHFTQIPGLRLWKG